MGISIECEAKSMDTKSVLNAEISRLSPIYAPVPIDTDNKIGSVQLEKDVVDITDDRDDGNSEPSSVAAAMVQQVCRFAFGSVTKCELFNIQVRGFFSWSFYRSLLIGAINEKQRC